MNFLEKSPEYIDLATLDGPWDLVYGPIESRRFGLSLGVNLAGRGHKICSFNCPYCDLGPTTIKISQLKKEILFPEMSQFETKFRDALVEANRIHSNLESIVISGNGEPTMHPEFFEVVSTILKVRGELAPKLPIVCLTNGAHLDSQKVLKALGSIDIPVVKVDAGNDDSLDKINNPLVRLNIAKLIQCTKKLKMFHVQSLFTQGTIDNLEKNQLDDWMEVVGILKPQMVYISTITRVPSASGLTPVLPQVLKEIAEKLTKKTGIKARAFA